MPAVTVVGSVHLDFVASAARLPRRGETVLGTGFAMHPGGKGGNQATQVALNGATAYLVARLGRDAFGARLRRGLTARGVDITHVTEDSEASTGTSAVLTGDEGDYASIIVPGAAARLGTPELAAARPALAASDVLLVQLEIDIATTAAAVAMAAELGKVVVLNAAPAPPDPDFLPSSLWRGVDVLIVNQVEAEMLGAPPSDDPSGSEAAGSWLVREYRVSAAVVTLGAAGAVLASGEGVRRYRGWPVAVVDTIGAGDAFAGVVASELARGTTLGAAVPLGNAAGALAVTRAGAYDGLPRLDAIRSLVASRAPESGSRKG